MAEVTQKQFQIMLIEELRTKFWTLISDIISSSSGTQLTAKQINQYERAKVKLTASDYAYNVAITEAMTAINKLFSENTIICK